MTNFVITSFASTKFVKVMSGITNLVIKIMKILKKQILQLPTSFLQIYRQTL
jgi:hypothetical protein